MADLIERDAVKKKKVVCSVSSMYIHSGKEFRASGYAGKALEFLDQVRRTEHRITTSEPASVYFLQARLGGVASAVDVCRDT